MKQDLFSERELRLAAAAADAAWQRALPTEDEGMPALSARFEQNMAGLLRRGRRQARRITFLRRTAAAMLALMAALSAWMAADGSARAAVVKWFRLEEENRVLYQFRESAALTELPELTLTWLPEGFELKEDVMSGSVLNYQSYMNRAGDMVVFHASLFNKSSNILLIGRDQPDMEPVKVQGLQGYYYPASGGEDRTNNLIWVDENLEIWFLLSSNLEKSVMLHIAENVVLSEPTK